VTVGDAIGLPLAMGLVAAPRVFRQRLDQAGPYEIGDGS
jgi:hypothetical protein